MKETFIKNLEHVVKDKTIEVLSFDFFDTLMSRRVPHPKDLFLILGEKLLKKKLLNFVVTPERFQELRVSAERKARQSGKSVEVTIEEIYDAFPPSLFSVDINQIIKEEISAEAEFLFPTNHLADLIAIAHRRGKKVIVVSDTYFSSNTLKEFWGNKTPNVPIEYFVSSEHRVGKYSTLFDEVLKKLKVPAGKIAHVGDNYRSDIESSSRRGIVSIFLPHGNSNFWDFWNKEVSLAQYHNERINKSFGDLGITALRCKATIFNTPEKVDTLSFAQYGSEVLGPILSVFCHWVARTAQDEGVDLILPLMREGYLIDKLLSFYPSIKSSPAYLSRRILFQANLLKVDRESLENLRWKNLESTIADYIKLIGLSPVDVQPVRKYLDSSLNNDEIFAAALDYISNSPKLLSKIKSRSEEIRRGIVAHFRRITSEFAGFAPKKVAVVDVGWNATIQRLLQNVLAEEKIDVEIIGLYMMTTPNVNELMFSGVKAKGYFVDGGLPSSEYDALVRTLEIFEQSCSPAHGSISHHDVRTGQPVLSPDSIPAFQRADIDDIQEGVLRFHEIYCRHIDFDISVDSLMEAAQIVRPILRRAMLLPSKVEAQLFKDWVHDDNLASGGTMSIMGNSSDLRFLAFKTLKSLVSTPMSEIYWPAGAMALTDPARNEKLSEILLHRISWDHFDNDLMLSSEICCAQRNSESGSDEFINKSHCHVFRNEKGLTYLKFELAVDDPYLIRWTPLSEQFLIRLDALLIKFQSEHGNRHEVFLDDEEALSRVTRCVGMTKLGDNTYAGQERGSAFYFFDLAQYGISGPGTLQLQIGCSISKMSDELPIRPKANSLPDAVTLLDLSKLHSGVPVLIGKSGAEIKDRELVFKKSEVAVEGIMLDPDCQFLEGEFFLQFKDDLGNISHFKLEKKERPDLSKKLGNPAVLNVGFAFKPETFVPGKYAVSIYRIFNETLLLGNRTWNFVIKD